MAVQVALVDRYSLPCSRWVPVGIDGHAAAVPWLRTEVHGVAVRRDSTIVGVFALPAIRPLTADPLEPVTFTVPHDLLGPAAAA